MTDSRQLAPERMLALAEVQQRSVEGRMAAFVPTILAAWGVALTGGFLALWVQGGGVSGVDLPMQIAGPLFVGLLVAAGVLSTVLGIRSSRGVRQSRRAAVTGIIYGQLWWAGVIVSIVMGQAMVVQGMPVELLTVHLPISILFFAGVMHVLSGLLWQAMPMLVLGGWTIVVAGAAGFAPAPAHFLVLALAAGGACFVVALWTAWWAARVRRMARAADDD